MACLYSERFATNLQTAWAKFQQPSSQMFSPHTKDILLCPSVCCGATQSEDVK